MSSAVHRTACRSISVARGDWQLRSDLNAALRRLKTGGRFEELVLRYFPYRVF